VRASQDAIRHVGFTALWLLIVSISAYDGCWVLANRNILSSVEENPLGRLLLHWNQGDVWLLLMLKCAGTIVAATAMLVLYWSRPRIAWVACAATACFQLCLLLYLVYPRMKPD
jgi:hypothetical protein